ncbi:hypothetical protein N177_0564 [Lutibaculum baratangense AMV1]|uniref:DUF6468 domain-containing protein n=1 Tax=Lutibaculum baratangense AMV1 TaxID=631454 RepID=V4RUM9_9HYPH|nr:hypothetical protein N177_0564 [Lutibaculum baratangense AMV1]
MVAVELLVAVLLATTIGYCALLNRRLSRLRADEAALKAMVVELVQASEAAERTVAEYRRTAAECDSDLAAKLKDAQHFSRFLTHEIDRGEAVLLRLARLGEMVRARRAAAAAARDEAEKEEGVARGRSSEAAHVHPVQEEAEPVSRGRGFAPELPEDEAHDMRVAA